LWVQQCNSLNITNNYTTEHEECHTAESSS
jgi:hypothetical protein